MEHYEFITSIDAAVVIDHIGRIDVGEGLRGQTFTVLRRLLDRGNIWVKLSGTDRISKQAYPYADAVPFARDLANARARARGLGHRLAASQSQRRPQ